MKIGSVSLSQRIERLAHRLPHLGPACWMSTVQYFVAQIAAAMATKSSYNWGTDPISYLGITACRTFAGEYVCSPLHAVFNLSLIALGVTMATGAILFYHQFNKSSVTLVGFSAIMVAALGSALVGAFPANTIEVVHLVGSGLAFIGGLVGVFTLSISLRGIPRPLRYVMISSGIISLTGLTLLTFIFFLGIDFKGAAERILSYPQILWLMMFGVYISIRRCAGRMPSVRPRKQRRR